MVHARTLVIERDSVSEMKVCLNHVVQLSAWKDFIRLCHHRSLKACVELKFKVHGFTQVVPTNWDSKETY
jgi:hypothetical protein